jgi:capsular polysaccharide transport system permease protein
MTTKTKARKFRIRRSPTGFTGAPGAQPHEPGEPAGAPDPSDMQAGTAAPGPEAAQPGQPQQGYGQSRFPQSAPQPSGQPAQGSAAHDQAGYAGQVSSAAETEGEQDLDAIRKEGLTGRQLRMARRLAQKHGLAPTSDFDAVRLLRAKGIDPFQRSTLLELVSNTGGGQALGRIEPERIQLPQTVPAHAPAYLPSTQLAQAAPAERRQQEIMEIQRDIARRRRRKMALLASRIFAFVLLPTLVVGYYFFAVATPMYSSKSEFLILTADGSGSASGAAGLFSGTAFATGQDSIATQSYLESKDAMLRLDRDVGFRDHFSQPSIDPIQRLDPGASNEAAYKVYQKYVTAGLRPDRGCDPHGSGQRGPRCQPDLFRKADRICRGTR